MRIWTVELYEELKWLKIHERCTKTYYCYNNSMFRNSYIVSCTIIFISCSKYLSSFKLSTFESTFTNTRRIWVQHWHILIVSDAWGLFWSIYCGGKDQTWEPLFWSKVWRLAKTYFQYHFKNKKNLPVILNFSFEFQFRISVSNGSL